MHLSISPEKTRIWYCNGCNWSSKYWGTWDTDDTENLSLCWSCKHEYSLFIRSLNVTLGVPQIKEIINAAKKITTPIITAKLLSAANLTGARMIKARIEKTLLGQMAKSVKIVISLDMETIQVSQLCIDHSVKQSVLQTSKLKLNEHQVKVLNPRKLEVFPHADKAKLQFELHRLKNKLPSVVVKGITMVQRAVVNKEQQKDRKNDVKGETYEFLVEGTGLLAVMGTEGSDGRNTKNNDIMEVKQTLGIEAARVSIIDEINYTMSSHGMTIDLRHMMLLADLMTYKGDVLGITRHGVQKMKDSVLMLASFEKTTDHLFNASVNGKDDKIEGVSECIIMGIPMQIVTGMFKLRQWIGKILEMKLENNNFYCGGRPYQTISKTFKDGSRFAINSSFFSCFRASFQRRKIYNKRLSVFVSKG
ncbi:hypothetical protein P3L10_029989 [Capsicum annuum]